MKGIFKLQFIFIFLVMGLLLLPAESRAQSLMDYLKAMIKGRSTTSGKTNQTPPAKTVDSSTKVTDVKKSLPNVDKPTVTAPPNKTDQIFTMDPSKGKGTVDGKTPLLNPDKAVPSTAMAYHSLKGPEYPWNYVQPGVAVPPNTGSIPGIQSMGR